MEGAAQSNHQQNNIMDSYESTENALMDSFKAAALKVTTLYKDSLVQNRKSYAAGYQQALQDLYEFISAQPENGYIPVQDVLSFARQKNNQLTCEMGGSSIASPANNPPTTAAATTQPPVQQIVTPSSRLQQQQNDELLQQQQKFVGNPFQIDPHSQFTFTHDIVPLSNGRTVDGVWDQATNNSTTTEGFKRRMMPAEVSFMGRSMSMDAWHEQQPPLKRGRLRREEQLQLQLQQQQLQQQQQLLQQQQHMFQQQQQQQQQNNAQSSQFHQL